MSRRGTAARLRRLAAPIGAVAACALLALPAAAWAGTFLPERGGSPNADDISSLYAVVLVLAGIVFVGVTGTLVFFVIRYRQRRSPVAAQIHGHTRLELGWTTAATLLIVFIAVFSLTKLNGIEHPDRAAASPADAATVGIGNGKDDALHIKVIGRQYVWMYKYPNGAYSYQQMVAPVGVTVKLDISSSDVAHSWWIPKLGGKLDAIPGYVNHTWFRLEHAGIFRGQCAELCGRNHANMLAQVRGVSPSEYMSWVARQKKLIAEANSAAARERSTVAPEQ